MPAKVISESGLTKIRQTGNLVEGINTVKDLLENKKDFA